MPAARDTPTHIHAHTRAHTHRPSAATPPHDVHTQYTHRPSAHISAGVYICVCIIMYLWMAVYIAYARAQTHTTHTHTQRKRAQKHIIPLPRFYHPLFFFPFLPLTLSLLSFSSLQEQDLGFRKQGSGTAPRSSWSPQTKNSKPLSPKTRF